MAGKEITLQSFFLVFSWWGKTESPSSPYHASDTFIHMFSANIYIYISIYRTINTTSNPYKLKLLLSSQTVRRLGRLGEPLIHYFCTLIFIISILFYFIFLFCFSISILNLEFLVIIKVIIITLFYFWTLKWIIENEKINK